MADVQPSDRSGRKVNGWLALGIVAVSSVVIIWIVGAAYGSGASGPAAGSEGDALTARTCEIFRDIAGDGASGIDTIAEGRERFKHLLDGYGNSAPSDIAGPLRSLVAALTNLDLDAAGNAVTQISSACSMRGY